MTQMTARQKGDGQSMSEFDLIKRLFAPMADPVSSGDLQDDAACYSPPAKHDLIISTDALVSGVHFPENAPPEMVAARLVGANVSDLAAKGARPVGCVLTLCVGPHWDSAYLEAFAQALKTQLETYAMPLWGGDTVSGPTALVSLSVHGVVPHGEMLTRKGAGPAEDVYVTGTIGDGFLGLKEVQSGVPAAGNVASSAYCAYASQHRRLNLARSCANWQPLVWMCRTDWPQIWIIYAPHRGSPWTSLSPIYRYQRRERLIFLAVVSGRTCSVAVMIIS